MPVALQFRPGDIGRAGDRTAYERDIQNVHGRIDALQRSVSALTPSRTTQQTGTISPAGSGVSSSITLSGATGIYVNGKSTDVGSSFALSVGVTGILLGNGSGISAATISPSNTTGDYVGPADTRLSDARTPTGSAGGDLTGTYPNPSLISRGIGSGTVGDSTHVPVLTYNDKGLITGVSTAAIGSGTGTVTSVGLTMPSGFSVSGSPVTTTGTLAVTTSLSGMIKGTGSGFTTGTAGTDYLTPSTGVTSVNTLVGGVTLAAGTNVTFGTVGNTITINSTAGGSGVTSLNSLTGALTISGSGNITVGAGGSNITLTVPTGGTGTFAGFTFSSGFFQSYTAPTTVEARSTVTSTSTISGPASSATRIILIPIDATSGNITLTLPSASSVFSTSAFVVFTFKRIDNSVNTITIVPAGTDVLDYGAPTVQLTLRNQSYEIIAYSASQWWIR